MTEHEVPSPAVTNPPSDLTDPVQLARECAALAEGMQRQSETARTGTAMGAHPAPAFFYNKVAVTLKAAADMISKGVNATDPPTPNPEPVKSKK